MGLKPDQPSLNPPENLKPNHDLESFDSGNEQLNQWLKKRALKNEGAGASRTYVLCYQQQVIAYYSLATGAVAQTTATGRVRRNMPDPIPVMLIGRLAVDQNWQGRGIGKAILQDAILRILQAAEIAGIRAILVHAISEEAKQFYERYGFIASLLEPMTLMIKVSDAKSSD
ncbi:MAG: GNAT family N-acetyltransferase [Thermosynechococcaceae cyanobacterium]